MHRHHGNAQPAGSHFVPKAVSLRLHYYRVTQNAERVFENFRKIGLRNSPLRYAAAEGALEKIYMGAQQHSFRCPTA